MTVIAKNDHGWLVCCNTYINEIYGLCIDANSTTKQLRLNNAFFDIKTPFFTNSKSQKCGKLASLKQLPNSKKRKKNIQVQRNQLDDLETVAFICKNVTYFITTAKELKHLEDSEISPEEWFENNGNARKAASTVLNQADTCYEAKELTHKNSSLHPIIKKFGYNEYVLPPQSTFYLCDISSFFEIVDEKYDLIILDPPWVNRSVKRMKSYHSLKYECLRNLPFEKLANPGCLIVVWITNSSSAASFVTDQLFPKCSVIHTSMWHWCKVTKKGTFVYPIDSHHKKPYENILLGRVQYESESDIRPTKEIDSKKVIVSVPSSIHSFKPPLAEMLKDYLKPDAKCLELFARNLLPGWTSVGNEVLKLQNIKLFDVSPACDN